MKTLINSVSIIVASLFIVSCSSKKNATNESATLTTPKQVTQPSSPEINSQNPAPQSMNKSNTTRFVVSFYSIGEGIDTKTNEEFVSFINSYPKKVAYEPQTWGREGELIYCLGLTELNSVEQTEFIRNASSILSKSKLVHKKENSSCDQTNWDSNDATLDGDKYRLVVSFFSEGGGIDLNNKSEFEKFITEYPKKIVFTPTTWGREGETDYCLKINELTPAEQIEFVAKTKEICGKSKLVRVNENTKCVHKQ